MSHEASRDFAVLTATPDLIAQGLVDALVARLGQHGARVVGAMPYAFSAPAAAELYGGRITHSRNESRLHSGWLNPQLFTAGSSLILFLRSDATPVPLVDIIREIKGGSRMGERTSEQLRSLSPIIDRGFSLVHSPDDFQGVLHELELVLGERGIAELLDPARPVVGSEEIVSILPFAPLAAERQPFDILPRVVGQVAATCACAPMNVGVAATASRLFEQVQSCRRELAGETIDDKLDRSLWRTMSRLGDAIGALMAVQRQQLDWALSPIDLRRVLRTAELLSTIASSCLERRFTVMECETMIEAFSACHLSLSGWDKHRLRLISAYHRH